MTSSSTTYRNAKLYCHLDLINWSDFLAIASAVKVFYCGDHIALLVTKSGRSFKNLKEDLPRSKVGGHVVGDAQRFCTVPAASEERLEPFLTFTSFSDL